MIDHRTMHAWGNASTDVARLLWACVCPDPLADATHLEGTLPKQRMQEE